MRFKKEGNNSPEIIVTFKFETSTSVESFSRYVDYSDRESAVVVDNIEQAFENHEEPETDFEKMIGYMKRDTAIVNKDERRTGLFSEHSNNISIDELEELKEKLNQGQALGNNLWNPVVSFDVAFLIRVGVLEYNPELEEKIDQLDKVFKAAEKENPKNSKKIYQAKKALEVAAKQRVVDQDKLKFVVQSNMGKFLRSEGFDENVFWWGSVHLNTKHIHMHLSFSELKPTRKMMEVPKEVNGKTIIVREARGKLKKKNIAKFKSNLYHSLEVDEEKRLKIEREVKVGMHRQAILSGVNKVSKDNFSLCNFYLLETAKHLPKEGKINYQSNRKEFREAKAYLTAFVEEYVRTIGKDDYTAFTEATKKQLEFYKESYSTNPKFNLEKLVIERQNVLKASLANKMIKEIQKSSIDLGIYGEDSDFLNSKELEQIVEDLKDTKISSKESGKYKWLLKVSYAEADEQIFKQKLRELEHFEDLKGNADLKKFIKQKFQEQISLAQYEQMPNYVLTLEEKDMKRKFQQKNTSARNFPIKSASDILINERMKELNKELKIVEQTRDKGMIKSIYQMEKKQVLSSINKEKTILEIKNQIYNNNQNEKRADNKALFNQLKEIYGEKSQNLYGNHYRSNSKRFSKVLKTIDFNNQKKNHLKMNQLMSGKLSYRHFQEVIDKNQKIFQGLASLSNIDRKRVERLKRQSDEEEKER